MSIAIFLTLCSCGGGNSLNKELIPVKSGEAWGYINLEGTYIINPQFDEAYPFTDGLALVRKGGLYGYIDTEGSYVVNPKYSAAASFTSHVAWTVEKGGAPTLIDEEGKTLFSLKDVEKVWPFSESMAKFEKAVSDTESKYGFVNLRGEVIIPPIYDSAGVFSEGLANVMEGNATVYIDKDGRKVINDSLLKNTRPFHNGTAVVGNGRDFGTIDRKGKFVINPQFSEMAPDGDLFIISTSGNGDNNVGWCDKNGKFVINPQFGNAFPFGSADLAPVMIGKSWGYVDKKGKIVINPQFDYASSFIDNRVAIVETGGKFGLIDKEGKYTVNPQFNSVSYSYIMTNINPSYYLAGNQRVETEYFNMDAALDMAMEDISDGGIDGVTFTTPLSKILKKYDIDENYLYSYSGLTRLRRYSLGRDLVGELSIDGDFFHSVSDGWWGTTQVITKNATPKAIHYTLSTRGRSDNKEEEILSALSERLKLKMYDDKSGARGRYGKNEITLFLMGDGVDIVMTPGNKTGNSVSDTDSGTIQPVGETTEGKVYEGKIDNKYGIVMELSINDEYVTGSYYYTSKKSPITLSGSIDNGNIIRLEETVKGKSTGQFVGSYTPDEISGTWISADGGKEMPFIVTRNNQ